MKVYVKNKQSSVTTVKYRKAIKVCAAALKLCGQAYEEDPEMLEALETGEQKKTYEEKALNILIHTHNALADFRKKLSNEPDTIYKNLVFSVHDRILEAIDLLEHYYEI